MRVLLQIGFEDYLLPDETGLATLLKILGKAQRVRDHLFNGEIELLSGSHASVRVSAQIVPAATRYVQRPPAATPASAEPVDHVIDIPGTALVPARRRNGSAPRRPALSPPRQPLLEGPGS